MLQPGTILNKRYRVLHELKGGGFSRIFEVRDLRQRNLSNGLGFLRSRSIKILKVLNCSDSSRKDVEFLFRREIGILKNLDHPNIVRYWDSFDHIENGTTLPCLVLEKVPGQTLEAWLQENGSASEAQILEWLAQFVEILDYLHNDQRIMHLDIKPANVMITPQGQLVLIDFGIARPISQTLLAKLVETGEPQNRRAGTTWYMAPEQAEGKPTSQSDVYAVGRTLVQAIANCQPHDIPQDDEGGWDWSAIAPHFSPETQSLLTDITTYSVGHRLVDLAKIFHKAISVINKEFSKTQKFRYQKTFKGLFSIVLNSILITMSVFSFRHLGILQRLDLLMYDQFTKRQLNLDGKKDEKLLLIEITAEDTQRYEDEFGIRDQSRLPGQILEKLINKIQPHNPSVIAIDVAQKDVIPVLPSNSNNVILGCASSSENADFQISTPKKFPLERVGYFDIIPDFEGYRIRRHVLMGSGAEHCNPGSSFSYQIVKQYLRSQNLSFSEIGDTIYLNGHPIKRLRNHQAFYDRINDSGYQTIINYHENPNVTDSAKLFDVLDEKIGKHEIFGNIIIVGSTDQFYGDVHATPYGIQPGVVVHLHMVSDLIRIALGERKSLNYQTRSMQFLHSFAWTLIGLLSIRVLSIRESFLVILSLGLFSLAAAYYAFILAFWIVPISIFWIPLFGISLHAIWRWQKIRLKRKKSFASI